MHMEPPPSRHVPPMDYRYDDYNSPPEPYDSYGPPRGVPGPGPGPGHPSSGPNRYPGSREPVSSVIICGLIFQIGHYLHARF